MIKITIEATGDKDACTLYDAIRNQENYDEIVVTFAGIGKVAVATDVKVTHGSNIMANHVIGSMSSTTVTLLTKDLINDKILQNI